jgi:hypothetical protein
MALTESGREAVALRHLAASLGITLEGPTIIKEDNDGATALAYNPVNHGKTKHIDIRHFYIRILVDDNTCAVQRAPSPAMLADIFTKSLRHDILAGHVSTMMSTE